MLTTGLIAAVLLAVWVVGGMKDNGSDDPITFGCLLGMGSNC